MDLGSELPDIDEEKAFHIIVRFAREGYRTSYSNYGYEIYLPNLIRAYLTSELRISDHEVNSGVR